MTTPIAINCERCGAPLPAGGFTVCTYCGTDHVFPEPFNITPSPTSITPEDFNVVPYVDHIFEWDEEPETPLVPPAKKRSRFRTAASILLILGLVNVIGGMAIQSWWTALAGAVTLLCAYGLGAIARAEENQTNLSS